jgi:putative salt-induced outer membrane protein
VFNFAPRKSIQALIFLAVLLALETFAVGDEEKKPTLGLHDESEVGIILLAGNSNSQSYNLKQMNYYSWGSNNLKFEVRYLNSTTNGIQTARSWALGTRFERDLGEQFGIFLAQNLESDIFAGYFQRYNTDLGGKYILIDSKDFDWNGELGYRFTVENGSRQVVQSYLRFYTITQRNWSEAFSTKFWLELLPNLTVSDYQINSEISSHLAINKSFAIKIGYLLKFRKIPVAPATNSTDTQYTTALVAKF